MALKERDLYSDVAHWFEFRLRSLYSNWQIQVHDTSRVKLSSFLDRLGLSKAFPGSDAFEIEVDITGILRRGSETRLAFVECKIGPITLKDLGQILGYSRVASPALSVILSPNGMSASLGLLLSTYNRVDLLEYGDRKRLKIGMWDTNRKQVDPASVLPPGELG
jgi:hypothetical protein